MRLLNLVSPEVVVAAGADSASKPLTLRERNKSLAPWSRLLSTDSSEHYKLATIRDEDAALVDPRMDSARSPLVSGLHTLRTPLHISFRCADSSNSPSPHNIHQYDSRSRRSGRRAEDERIRVHLQWRGGQYHLRADRGSKQWRPLLPHVGADRLRLVRCGHWQCYEGRVDVHNLSRVQEW